MELLRGPNRIFDRFLFESCSLETCALLRIGYALLLVINVSVWWIDAQVWFSDLGVMTSETAEAYMGPSHWSVFYWLPSTPFVVNLCMGVLLLQSVLLLLGVFSRYQAAMIFFWLVSFQNRSPMMLDGEDTVFRVFAFFLILLPADKCWSLTSILRSTRSVDIVSPSAQAWAVRLFQIQIAVIYVSAAWCKALGPSWQFGSALYYVYQMGDTFGRGPLPEFLTQTEWVIRSTTWGVMVLEAVLPLLLFVPKTRRWGLLVGILLHLSMEYAMHLFLFQWIMMLGLLSFSRPSDYSVVKAWLTAAFRPKAANVASGDQAVA